MNTHTTTALQAAEAALRKANQTRAKANRNRDILAGAYIDGDSRVTPEIVLTATLAAARAARAAQAASNAVQAFITPTGYTAAAHEIV